MHPAIRRSLGLLVIVAAAATQTSIRIAAQSAGPSVSHPPAAFADPDRRAKLATAFPEIDRLVAAFMERTHVPGAAWGIVIDGELAHIGVAGYREVPTKAAVTRDSVFRIASMTKSFTAMAILKLRDEGKLSLDDLAERHVPELKGLRYPTSDSPRLTVRHLMSHATGFPEDNPVGRSAACRNRSRVLEDAADGHPVFEYAGRRLRILQLRLRDPRAHRDQRLGHSLSSVHRARRSSNRSG